MLLEMQKRSHNRKWEHYTTNKGIFIRIFLLLQICFFVLETNVELFFSIFEMKNRELWNGNEGK